LDSPLAQAICLANHGQEITKRRLKKSILEKKLERKLDEEKIGKRVSAEKIPGGYCY
jgi:hypothetical protein